MNAQRVMLLAALLGLLGINAPAAADDHSRSGRKFSHDAPHRVHDRGAYRQTRHHYRQDHARGGYRAHHYRADHARGRYHYKPRHHHRQHGNPAWRAHDYRPHFGNNYGYGRGSYGAVGYGSGISVWVDGLGFTFYDHGY